MDRALAPHQPLKCDFVSDFSDKYYAISEAILDEERSKVPGWMSQNARDFANEHGNVAEIEEVDHCDSAEETAKCEEEICPDGACCETVRELPDYPVWNDCIKAVLRISRAVRKKQGYVPQHPLVALRPRNMIPLHVGDTILLLAKVQYRPYDCTMVTLTIEPENPCVASMVPRQDGLPDVVTMHTMLRDISAKCDPKDFSFQVLTYTGRRFGKIEVLTVETLEEAANKSMQSGEVVALDSEEEEEQKQLKQRADMLRHALNAATSKPKAKAKTKASSKDVAKHSLKQNRKGSKAKAKPKPDLPAVLDEVEEVEEEEDPEEPGVSGQMHDQIETAWKEAWEEELPKEPQASSGSSASAAAAATDGKDATVAPENESTKPWKDDKGNVFLPKDGKRFAVHLGPGLRPGYDFVISNFQLQLHFTFTPPLLPVSINRLPVNRLLNSNDI